MKRLALNVDTLTVQSFSTSAVAEAARGTMERAGAKEGTGQSHLVVTHCTCHDGCHWTA